MQKWSTAVGKHGKKLILDPVDTNEELRLFALAHFTPHERSAGNVRGKKSDFDYASHSDLLTQACCDGDCMTASLSSVCMRESVFVNI